MTTETPTNQNHELSKTEYILSLPHLSAKEVVARVKAEGFEATEAQVYSLRAYQKKKAALLLPAAGAVVTPAPRGRPAKKPVRKAITAAAPGPLPGRLEPLVAAFKAHLVEMVEAEILGRVRSAIALALANGEARRPQSGPRRRA